MQDYFALYSRFIDRYGLPIVKALIILLVGWAIAKAAAFLIGKLVKRIETDSRLGKWLASGATAGVALETGVSRFVYWLLMLVVVMAVLQSLGLTIITEPLSVVTERITAFMPQVLAAAFLVLIAWAVATVLRVIVSNLLGAFELDKRMGETAGEETKKVSLAGTLADGLYYLVFLLFLPQILDALEMEGLSPVKNMVGEIIGFLPNLLGAVIVFFLFYLVARIVQRLATNLLTGFGFNNLPRWLGFGEAKEGRASASAVAGYVLLTVFLFIGLIQACNTLSLAIVSELANELLQGIFKIVVACAIFAVGLLLSRLVYQALSAEGRAQSKVLALVARAAILVFTGAMALHKADLAPEIVNLAFGSLIVGVTLAGGLAIGLAFGLGGRKEAEEMIALWRGREELGRLE